jgi:acyl carrier protein
MGMESGRTYVAARNETERVLVEIWQEILGKDQIGVYDDFFELGGHSLKATRLVAAIRKKFNIQYTIKDIFLGPTIEEIASAIDSLLWVKDESGDVLGSDIERFVF